ncbi:MAG: L-glutamate gamma-semialdehyde dehydrogenase [Proteobacteria bacterium]|uniref:L-glutamate gamma-semialdehyde dehydrogenase n=1 Tax=Aquabacterium sp. TaxID=1872578 RepID=UPI0035C6CA26|nr:L-glutamate gamma-semialdehyde dehydrogenase [Pseudomonadota bacterium]
MRLPPPDRPETDVVRACLHSMSRTLDWPAAAAVARPWVETVRAQPEPFWALASLLREFPISSQEGLALMRLAEALLRVPDADTAIALTADQLAHADFAGQADSALGRLAHTAVALSRHFLPDTEVRRGLAARLGTHQGTRWGAQAVVHAAVRAVQLLGQQFVLGEHIDEALRQAARTHQRQPHVRFSFDMLGEGARTEADAQRYLASHAAALDAIAHRQREVHTPALADGLSIKLSALHPRHEEAQRERVLAELVPRVWTLCERAAEADLNLTLDAEEAERLELSLDVAEALVERIAAHHPQWQGFGLALQAYQTRALPLVEHMVAMARRHGVRLMCRLVKGAYWDAEVKRAQELGLAHFPVFTHKPHTDISYLACAQALLAAPDAVYPQFATHNAGTIAALLQMARQRDARFELQRLHGMGEAIYREVLHDPLIRCRVYAPVGPHRELLAYLVRRLLENGANASFVHQLADPACGVDELLRSPLDGLADAQAQPPVAPPVTSPDAVFGPGRRNSQGLDLSVARDRALLLRAWQDTPVPVVADALPSDVALAAERGQRAVEAWRQTPVTQRANCLRRAADMLQARLPAFGALLVREGRKTWPDAVAEVREAIDFLRYDAGEAERVMAPLALPVDGPGITGETNTLCLHGRGLWACISPWNFPLAIFTGQVAAALATGNTVLAKPAEQTPGVAQAAVALLHEAGVPAEVLQLLHGPGETVGAALVAHPAIAGVAFTGSTAVAKHIQRALAAKDGPIVPLIAETGGINAMLVDPSALPEQVCDAVVHSAFRSAGQRCSALRLLCLHEDIAEPTLRMIAGAVQTLRVGDPARFDTDIGPLIDAEAHARVSAQLAELARHGRRLWPDPMAQAALPASDGPVPQLMAPQAFEVDAIGRVREEIFGPVLQVLRWRGDPAEVIARVNALGWGLTLGLQTRIDSRAQALAAQARVGNVYVNRSMVGAVVGLQPFGGEGFSGTGPKAGGPHYLPRFCVEQTVSVNTAAAGGNVALMAGGLTPPASANPA